MGFPALEARFEATRGAAVEDEALAAQRLQLGEQRAVAGDGEAVAWG